MGRIDDALRRVGTVHTQIADARETERTAIFDAPWSFAGRSAVENVREEGFARTPAATVPREKPQPQPLTGISSQWAEKLALSPTIGPAFTDQFRRLAASLYHAQVASGLKIVMVTSAAPGDGKSLTAVNLAFILSESHRRRVLLIDADLRRPSISNLTRVPATTGLGEVLRSKQDHKLTVIQVTEFLSLLPAGRPDPDPISGLTSERMHRILTEASSRFDWVILDAPPVGPVPDANLLATLADAVLLVIRAAVTPHAPIQKTIDALGREKLFGVVLNAVDETALDPYERQYQETRSSPDSLNL